MGTPSLGLYFDNYEHFMVLPSLLVSYVRESRDQIKKVYEILTSGERIYFTGVGRSGLVASRGVENFDEGLNRESYFATKGTIPSIEEDDVLIAVSSSGEKEPTIINVDSAIEKKANVIGITSNESSRLAKKSNAIIKVPGRGPGEDQIKQFYGLNLIGKHLPLRVMGSTPEFCSLITIDSLSYALANSSDLESFYELLEGSLFGYSTYLADIYRHLEQPSQQTILENMINILSFKANNVFVTAYKFTTTVGEMLAIRLNNVIYEKGKRRSDIIDSRNARIKIEKSDSLVAISGFGNSPFTLDMAKMYRDADCEVFSATMNPDSELAKLVGEDKTLTFPKSPNLPLKDGYSIREFDACALAPLDCFAMEIMNRLGRSEEEAKKTHSTFT